MKEVQEVIQQSRDLFLTMMMSLGSDLENEDRVREVYIRYLSMQYHLTKGVERPLYRAASHPSLRHRRELREFFVEFADEEAPHFQIAELDLRELGATVRAAPLDVQVYRAYFERAVEDRPFIRFGATCVLENITSGSSGLFDVLVNSVSFLSEKSTRFFRLHQHGADIPHGEEVLDVLSRAELSETELAELAEGARAAMVLYLRLVHWALHGKEWIG